MLCSVINHVAETEWYVLTDRLTLLEGVDNAKNQKLRNLHPKIYCQGFDMASRQSPTCSFLIIPAVFSTI
jgi:hypothetical protein